MTTEQLISEQLRHDLFVTVYGISCGPLLGATILLPFVAVVFHDFAIMTGLFIHILPPMVMYTFRWNYQRDSTSVATVTTSCLTWTTSSSFLTASGFSFLVRVWVLLLVIQLLSTFCGLYHICFGCCCRDGSSKKGSQTQGRNRHCTRLRYCLSFDCPNWIDRQSLEKHSGDVQKRLARSKWKTMTTKRRDFLVYIGMHAILVCSSVYLLAYPCYLNQKFIQPC